jgi:STE24 endopeptidase
MIWLLLFIIGIFKIVNFFIVWGGEYFYIYVWMFLVLFSFIMIIIYPNLIAPCFNKYQNLEDGELKTQIEGLAKRLKFPLKKIFVTDSSKRYLNIEFYF